MNVAILDIFLICLSPSLFWLGYWTWRGHLGTPKPHLVVAFFAAGFLGAPVALGLFSLMELSPFYEQLATMETAEEWQRFAWCLFAIGPVEELAKFLVAWASLRLLGGQANPLLGGPLYAAATALGFATVENWYYMLEIEEVVWHRALTLPFNHVLFSSFWGVGL